MTAVCSVGHDDKRSGYSESGANLWVCGPSSSGRVGQPRIATTDNGHRYRGSFGGTSAATPIVSGVVALVREANNALTWRDVKLILAASARKNDPGNTGWVQGALKYGSTTNRYSFNHEYGFGIVDAKAAVDLAPGWTNVRDLREITPELIHSYDSDRADVCHWPVGPICVFPNGTQWHTHSARIAHVAGDRPGAQKLPGCCGGQDHRPPTLESSAQKVGTARGVPKSPRRRGGGGVYVSSSTSGRWKADPKGTDFVTGRKHRP